MNQCKFVFHREAQCPFRFDMVEVGGSNPPGPTKQRGSVPETSFTDHTGRRPPVTWFTVPVEMD